MDEKQKSEGPITITGQFSFQLNKADSFSYLKQTKGKNYPIYGTQWHPEKCQFEWEPKEAIDHSPDAVLVGQYMANFFVKQGTLTNFIVV